MGKKSENVSKSTKAKANFACYIVGAEGETPTKKITSRYKTHTTQGKNPIFNNRTNFFFFVLLAHLQSERSHQQGSRVLWPCGGVVGAGYWK
jgi:hypothetical protein